MKTIVLCVDRDDDFGSKAGLYSPFIGREENMTAANALALADPEDSDMNAIFMAIKIYDQLRREGKDVEIATICGDSDVGLKSDAVLSAQLDMVIKSTGATNAVLVSDGAEDEYINPMIGSRMNIDSVKKVYVKQSPTMEGAFYILVKYMRDDKIRKFLSPVGLAILVYGLFSILDPLVSIFDGSSISFSSMGGSVIWLVIGFYIFMYANRLDNTLKSYLVKIRNSIRSGSLTIPFTAMSLILLVIAVIYGADAASAVSDSTAMKYVLAFIGGFLWLAVFGAIIFQVGKFINNYATSRKVTYGAVVESIMTLAIAFLVQGTVDFIGNLYGFASYDSILLIFEFVIGFGLAVFSGMISFSFRSIRNVQKGGAE